MPIERRLDAVTQILHTRIFGRVSLDDMRDHFTAVKDMGGQKYPEMVDSRGVTRIAVFENPAAAEGWLDHIVRITQGTP